MQEQAVKTPRQLRRFGLVMAVPLGLIAAVMAWKGRTWWPAMAGAAAAFALLGLAFPRLLGPVERAWMRFALVLSRITTTVLLALTFVLLITPLGLLLRLLGKRPLALSFDKRATTYWRPVEPHGPGTRPHQPY
jgi:hypothetical protein